MRKPPTELLLHTLSGRLAARLHHAGAAVERPRRVIALHGWLDNAATYDYLAPRIAREFEADVACLDFPGHGASDHRAHSFGVGYSFLDYSASVLSFINALGWGGEEVHLVGHSMGAATASLVAGTLEQSQAAVSWRGTLPKAGTGTGEPPSGGTEPRLETTELRGAPALQIPRVSTCVMIDGIGSISRDDAHAASTFATHVMGTANVAARAAELGPKTYPHLDAAVAARLAAVAKHPATPLGPQFISQEAAQAILGRGSTEVPGAGGRVALVHDPKVLCTFPVYLTPAMNYSFLDAMADIPALLLEPTQGWPFPPAENARLKGRLNNLTTARIAGGHHCHADPASAPQTADAVIGFLRRSVS